MTVYPEVTFSNSVSGIGVRMFDPYPDAVAVEASACAPCVRGPSARVPATSPCSSASKSGFDLRRKSRKA